MVDIVVNNVMATSVTPDYSKFMFKDPVRVLLISKFSTHWAYIPK